VLVSNFAGSVETGLTDEISPRVDFLILIAFKISLFLTGSEVVEDFFKRGADEEVVLGLSDFVSSSELVSHSDGTISRLTIFLDLLEFFAVAFLVEEIDRLVPVDTTADSRLVLFNGEVAGLLVGADDV
jgi:hypothetical protein